MVRVRSLGRTGATPHSVIGFRVIPLTQSLSSSEAAVPHSLFYPDPSVTGASLTLSSMAGKGSILSLASPD